MGAGLKSLWRWLNRGRVARLREERQSIIGNIAVEKKNHRTCRHLYARLRTVNAELMRLGA